MCLEETHHRTAAERLREAETVRDELMEALRAAGIPLPSVRLEPAAYGDLHPRPLVELGRCNLPTARKLTAALRTAPVPPEPQP